MNAATVSRMMSLIPERTSRSLSGTGFVAAAAGACKHPERFAHLVEFLQWLSPLYPITKDDQRRLGLVGANGRPVQAAVGLDDDPAEAIDLDAILDPADPEEFDDDDLELEDDEFDPAEVPLEVEEREQPHPVRVS